MLQPPPYRPKIAVPLTALIGSETDLDLRAAIEIAIVAGAMNLALIVTTERIKIEQKTEIEIEIENEKKTEKTILPAVTAAVKAELSPFLPRQHTPRSPREALQSPLAPTRMHVPVIIEEMQTRRLLLLLVLEQQLQLPSRIRMTENEKHEIENVC